MQKSTDSNPIILAEKYKSLLDECESLVDLATKVGKSASHCSRYLSLLNLPVEAKNMVSKGELPVTNAAKKYRDINKKKATKTFVLTNNQAAIITQLSTRVFATVSQLSEMISISDYSVRRSLSELLSRGLIERHDEIKPFIYRLSNGGAARMGCSYQRRWVSASAMHQYLMRNSIEIKFKKEGQNYFFWERKSAYRKGFYPGVGEHVLSVNSSDNEKTSLVIIDDYQMPLNRIAYRLIRPHNPMDRYYNGENQLWIYLIQRVVIFTCDEMRVDTIRKSIKDEISNIDKIRINNNDSDGVKYKKRLITSHKNSIIKYLSDAHVEYLPAVLEVR